MFADLAIEYRLVNDIQKSKWHTYKQPVPLPKNTKVELRNRLIGMPRTGRIISVSTHELIGK